MNWLAAIFFGLVTAVIGAAYGGWMASRAVAWLRISSFEGGSGYFVAFMILLGFVLSLIAGVTICRLAGGPGALGIARGLGLSAGTVLLAISAIGAIAWASADREPLVEGQPIDLAVEVRFPPGAARPEEPASGSAYVALQSGPRNKFSTGPLRFDAAREEGGRWIVPATVAVTVSEGGRTLSVRVGEAATQFFDANVPARPDRLDDDWGAWNDAPRLGSLEKPGQADALALRYRIVRRAPPAAPRDASPAELSPVERRIAAFRALAPDAPTAAFLDFTTLDLPQETRLAAVAAVRDRADFGAALADRIASPDPAIARDAMYLVGLLEPPPVEAGAAVIARAEALVGLAGTIDPAAPDSRDRLYDQGHVLASGILASAFGLRRAGVDLRPALRALAAAARPLEKVPPYDLADSAERIVAHWDQLDRDGR